jgi:dolichol-phosphate mannosyltransferase
MVTMQKISVILPTYNESESILPFVEEIHAVLAGREHEILVVDDNSPDGTYRLVSDAGIPSVRALLRTTDRGFANSIRHGLEQATGDVLIVMDSDFNHQPGYLPFMIDAIRYYDCVTASRFLYGGLMTPRSRHILSWLFNVFVRVATGGKITDNLYGFFAVRRDVLFRLDFDRIFWGYGDYCIRLLFHLERAHADILQFPSVIGRRRGGAGNRAFLKVFLLYTRETIKLALRRE